VKKDMKNEDNTVIGITSKVWRDNRIMGGIITLLLLAFIATLFVLTFTIYKLQVSATSTHIERLYTDPAKNNLVIYDDYSNDKIGYSDILGFIENGIVPHLDFKAKFTRASNLSYFEKVASGQLLETIQTKKLDFIKSPSNLLISFNKVTNMEPYNPNFPKDLSQEKKDYILNNYIYFEIEYEQTQWQTDNTIVVANKKVSIIFQKVMKKDFINSANIGGKYYGLIPIDITTDISNI